MQPVETNATRYDGRTIFYHWATAVLVVGQWVGAKTIDWFPRGALRVDARSVHITAGVVLMGLLVARVVWRGTGGRRLPLADRGLLAVVSKATHWGLYAMLGAMVGLGVFLTWVRGDSLFGWFSVPAFDPSNKALREEVFDWHATLGTVILIVAGVHAGAALVHRFVWRDGVLARMRPARPSSNR